MVSVSHINTTDMTWMSGHSFGHSFWLDKQPYKYSWNYIETGVPARGVPICAENLQPVGCARAGKIPAEFEISLHVPPPELVDSLIRTLRPWVAGLKVPSSSGHRPGVEAWKGRSCRRRFPLSEHSRLWEGWPRQHPAVICMRVCQIFAWTAVAVLRITAEL